MAEGHTPEVSIDIAHIGHIPAPIISVPLTEDNFSAEEWTIFKMLQHDLIFYYRQLLSKLQLSPLFDEIGHAANFFDIYVKPILTIPSQYGPKGQPQLTPVNTYHDIFEKNSKPCHNIYISSPAGCGKTAFLTYLTLIWCEAHLPVESVNQRHIAVDVNEMRSFMLLFFICLRDSNESECDVDIMIQQLLCRLANSDKYAKSGFLCTLLNNVKCIILLDGLDEWIHPHEKQCVWPDKHIPHSRARPLCTTMTTSRPWKLDVVRLKCDQKLELNGLEGDLLARLIGKVVARMNELHGKDMEAYDFEQELRDKKLTDLSKIPVVVMQLLTVWFDNEPLGESHCEIYSNMIEFLLKRYHIKREFYFEMEDIEVHNCSKDGQTPNCFQNQMYCKVHMELLSKLSTLACNRLFTENEESSHVFDRNIARKYLTDSEIEMSLAVGILTQEKGLCKISIRQSHISFIHRTFQEYLAALYVALNPGMVTEVEGKINRVCCSNEKIVEMSQIFMFLSGLCPEFMVNLHEHLRQTVSEDNRTQIYRASCELRSSEGETLRRVQDTMVDCLVECWLNGHKDVTHLPVSDFFIGSSSRTSIGWSCELKSLIVHNHICSLSVFGVYSPEEIEDIMNSVTVFNSIQKLWLCRVPETFVVQMVSQHKHSLSVRPNSWIHLKCVTLESVKGNIPGDILCSLVDSILQLCMSVQVSLRDCCIRQGTRDWKAYILSHQQLTVDDFDGDRGRNVKLLLLLTERLKLLKFHTNKV